MTDYTSSAAGYSELLKVTFENGDRISTKCVIYTLMFMAIAVHAVQ